MRKRNEINLRAGIWAGMLALLALLFPPHTTAAIPEKARLLVLHSFHQDLPWSKGLMQGVNTALEDTGLEIELHVEYLDAVRHRQAAIFPAQEAILASKYRHRPPSVVMTTDDIALDFVLARRDRLFPGIPLVFCAPNDFRADRIRGHTDITGVAEVPDFKGTGPENNTPAESRFLIG